MRQQQFESWLEQQYHDVGAEDHINPQYFLEWQRSLLQKESLIDRRIRVEAKLAGTTGERGRYRVLPIVTDDTINWIDAAGYLLAISNRKDSPFRGRYHRQDFDLHTDSKIPFVARSFSG